MLRKLFILFPKIVFENIRNETVCKTHTKHDLMQIKMAYNIFRCCCGFITIERESDLLQTWVSTRYQLEIKRKEAGEWEREWAGEGTRKTECAQRACIRRGDEKSERLRESMSSVRNGRKGACYTSTCISSSSTNVPVRVSVCARELEREEVKYAFRQLILTHNFYFTKWAYSVHWRRHSEGGRESPKGMERVSVCVCWEV